MRCYLFFFITRGSIAQETGDILCKQYSQVRDRQQNMNCLVQMMAISDFREKYLRLHKQIDQTLKSMRRRLLSQYRFEHPYGRWRPIPFICHWINIDLIRDG